MILSDSMCIPYIKKFQIGCTCCEQTVHLPQDVGYQCIYSLLSGLTTKAIHHRLLLKFSSIVGSLTSSSSFKRHSVSALEEDLSMLEENHIYQAPAIQSSYYEPKTEHNDSCMGNDKMILSAVLHEKEISTAMKK